MRSVLSGLWLRMFSPQSNSSDMQLWPVSNYPPYCGHLIKSDTAQHEALGLGHKLLCATLLVNHISTLLPLSPLFYFDMIRCSIEVMIEIEVMELNITLTQAFQLLLPLWDACINDLCLNKKNVSTTATHNFSRWAIVGRILSKL